MQIRRVVTGNNARGRAEIVDDATVEPLSVAAIAGVSFQQLWATENGTSLPGPPEATYSYFPGRSGSRAVIVTWAAAVDTTGIDHGADTELADAEQVLPGLLSALETEDPGFHTTQTIDYGLCLAGEIWLRLDDGQETLITPGTFVVQRGTRHAWENRADVPATIMFVQIGSDDTSKL